MLAAVNIGALVLGLAAAGMTATVLGLGVGAGLELIGVESGSDIGLILGVLGGLGAGGWVAGNRARHSSRFHGALAGLAFAALLVAVARLGGSPSPGLTVAWLGFVSALVGGTTGWVAGRRKARRIVGASSSGDRGRETEESPDSTGQGAG